MTLVDDLRSVRDAADAAIQKYRYADLNLDDRDAIRDVLRRHGGWLLVGEIRSRLEKGGRRLRSPVIRNRLNELGDVESRRTASQGRPKEYRFVAAETESGHPQ